MLKHIYQVKNENDIEQLVSNSQQQEADKIIELPLNNMNSKKKNHFNKGCFFISLFLILLVLLILFNLILIVLVYKRTSCDLSSKESKCLAYIKKLEENSLDTRKLEEKVFDDKVFTEELSTRKPITTRSTITTSKRQISTRRRKTTATTTTTEPILITTTTVPEILQTTSQKELKEDLFKEKAPDYDEYDIDEATDDSFKIRPQSTTKFFVNELIEEKIESLNGNWNRTGNEQNEIENEIVAFSSLVFMNIFNRKLLIINCDNDRCDIHDETNELQLIFSLNKKIYYSLESYGIEAGFNYIAVYKDNKLELVFSNFENEEFKILFYRQNKNLVAEFYGDTSSLDNVISQFYNKI